MPTSKIISQCEITQWIGDTIKENFFSKYDVEISGTSEKGDGYIGEITFATVNAYKEDGKREEFNFALKHGKKDKILRETMPIRLAFEREMFVYNTAVPAFIKFQEEKKLEPINFITKCFKTLLYDHVEVIVLQNLKKIGYDLHNRFIPMEATYLKLTLEAYAKWHALSFAYRNQKTEDFNRKFQNLECVFTTFFSNSKMADAIKVAEESVYDTLKEIGELVLLKKLKGQFKDGFKYMLDEVLNVEEPQSVFLHGDCWNNNMMFKYKDCDINKKNPEKVVLLDFQMSKLGSPVLDLSYHIYAVSSKEVLEENFEDLLKMYYSAFSKYLRALGSDPETLFSYSDLIRHWKRYSSFGLIFSSLVLPVALSHKENIKDIQDFDESTMNDVIRTVKETSKEEISSRTIGMVKNFLEFNNF